MIMPIFANMGEKLKALPSSYLFPYYFAFFLYCAWGWFDRTTLWNFDGAPSIGVLETVVQAAILLLLAISFLRQRAKVREWILAIFIGVVGFIVWRTAAEGWLFWIALFVICGKGVRIKPLATILLSTVSLVFVFSILASSFNLIENIVAVRSNNGVVRAAMGFSHPNAFGAALLTICMAAVPLFGRKKFLLLVLCFVAAGLSLCVADSRTSALCLLLVGILWPCYGWVSRFSCRRALVLALGVLVVAMVAMSTWYMLFYNPGNPIDFVLNSALSGRLRLANTYFLDHAPGLFGYNYADGTIFIDQGEELTFVVDNLYDHILLRYGILAWTVFLASIAFFISKAYKENCLGSLLFGMGIFLLYGMSETKGCRVDINFYIISLWTVLYHRPLSQFDDEASDVANVDSVVDGEISFREFLLLPVEHIRGRRG